MPKYFLQGRWIMTKIGSFDKIMGRVFGGPGYMHYQIAARPYDEVSVGPFADEQAAFEAAVRVLEIRDPTVSTADLI